MDSVAEKLSPTGRSLLPPLKMSQNKQQKSLDPVTDSTMNPRHALPSRKSILKNPQVVSVKPKVEAMSDENTGKTVFVVDVPPDIPNQDNPEQVNNLCRNKPCILAITCIFTSVRSLFHSKSFKR